MCHNKIGLALFYSFSFSFFYANVFVYYTVCIKLLSLSLTKFCVPLSNSKTYSMMRWCADHCNADKKKKVTNDSESAIWHSHQCVVVMTHTVHQVPVWLTIVWNDGPGHGWGVNSSDHPEHAQPAQMLSSLLPSQHLRKVREYYWYCSTNSANMDCCN